MQQTLHYPVELLAYSLNSDQQTKRERQIRARLIYCLSGLVSIRIGAHQYSLAQGYAYWLPANCLASVKAEHNSQVVELKLSARIPVLCKEACLIDPTPLLKAGLEALVHQHNLGGWQDEQGDILRLCLQQLARSTQVN